MRLTPRRTLLTTATMLLAVLAAAPSLASSGTSTSSIRPTERTDGGSAPPSVRIRPAELPRGANPRIPWIFGGELFEGPLRVDVGANDWLLGPSGDDYLVQVSGNDRSRVVRVAPDGSRTRVLTFPGSQQVSLATDGAVLFRSVYRRVEGRWRTVVRTHDPATGDLLDRRRFTGIVDVLDAYEGRVILGTSARTIMWDLAADTTRWLVRQGGYVADLRADRFGTLTGDVYQGGCTVLRRVSAPGEVLSRSCDLQVVAVSPSGRRVAAIGILSDGIGPRVVDVLSDTGVRLAEYRVADWFGRIDFESNRALLLEANGRSRQAVVRCVSGTCERATGTRPTPSY